MATRILMIALLVGVSILAIADGSEFLVNDAPERSLLSHDEGIKEKMIRFRKECEAFCKKLNGNQMAKDQCGIQDFEGKCETECHRLKRGKMNTAEVNKEYVTDNEVLEKMCPQGASNKKIDEGEGESNEKIGFASTNWLNNDYERERSLRHDADERFLRRQDLAREMIMRRNDARKRFLRRHDLAKQDEAREMLMRRNDARKRFLRRHDLAKQDEAREMLMRRNDANKRFPRRHDAHKRFPRRHDRTEEWTEK